MTSEQKNDYATKISNTPNVMLVWVHAWLMIGAASALVWPIGFTLAPLTLSITGFILLLIQKYHYVLHGSDRFLMLSFVTACWLFAIISSAIHIFNGTHWHIIAPHLPFLIYPFMAWVFFKVPKIDGRWLLRGAAIGAIMGLCYSGYMYFAHEIERATLHRSPISYGNTGVVLAGLCFLGLIMIKARFDQVLLLMGGMAGIGVSLLSGSRGGWLSIIILLFFIWGLMRYRLNRWRHLVLISLMGLMVTAAIHPNLPVASRLKQAVSDITNYYEHGNNNTSVGARLAMWSYAASIATERPILGFGFQGARDRWQQAISDGEYTSKIGGGHLHNEIIQIYITTGMVGLFLFLMVYGIGIRAFYLYRQKNSHFQNVFALCGMMTLIMYLEFGLTNGVWSNNANRQLFMFFIISLLGLAANRSRNNNEDA